VSELITIDIHVVSPLLAEHGVSCSFQGVWNPNPREQAGAWDLLVELVTRISVVGLKDDEGRLDAALESYAAIFGAARRALQRQGRTVAAERRGELSFATIVAQILNKVIRPVTAWWHPRVGSLDKTQAEKLRRTLADLSILLTEYAKVFAQACGATEFVRYLVDEGMHYRRPVQDEEAGR
jgi:hypothetical protein